MELGHVRWGAVTINETRRSSMEENIEWGSRHMWFGSGGAGCKHGVGVVLHKRWAKHVIRFQAISPRLAALDVQVAPAKSVRIVSGYFPPCGYPDAAVEEIYDMISGLLEQAKHSRIIVIIGADCNAEVGGDSRRMQGILRFRKRKQ